MAGGKESPRQKMIGMMYLVLTALLALNVSAEVLEAFNNITRSIDASINVTEDKNNSLYTDFKQRVDNSNGDPNAVACWERAQKAREIVDELDKFIHKVKVEVVERECNQAYSPESPKAETQEDKDNAYTVTGKLEDPKNIDVADMLFTEKKGGNFPGYGPELKQRINETRKKLVNLFDGLTNVDESYKNAVSASLTLEAKDNPDAKEVAKKEWEYATFHSVPRGAALALLTAIQSNAKNAEAEVVSRLYNQVSAGKKEIEDFVTVIKARKAAVAVGEKYTADIFLSAKIGSIEPIITVDGKEIPLEGSTGKYEVTPSSQGTQKKKVMITLKDAKTGKVEEYPADMEFDVFKAPAIISADKMNVVYQGLDNPISISVPGFEPDKIFASLTPGTVGSLVRTGPGKYVAKIKRRDRNGCNINVSVKLPDGKTKSMGSQNFRTMKVPSPIASLNGNTGPSMSTGAIKAVRIVSVTLDNFVFEGIRYRVSKFDYIWKPRRGTLLRGNAKGPQIPNQLRAAFNDASRGDLLIISGIHATAPGLGEVPLAGSLVFTIQ